VRRELKAIDDGNLKEFSGIVRRFGERKGPYGKRKTIMLTDICDENGHVVADHVWFPYTQKFKDLRLHHGDRVQFCARVRPYWKGYEKMILDFGLGYASNIRKIPLAPKEEVKSL